MSVLSDQTKLADFDEGDTNNKTNQSDSSKSSQLKSDTKSSENVGSVFRSLGRRSVVISNSLLDTPIVGDIIKKGYSYFGWISNSSQKELFNYGGILYIFSILLPILYFSLQLLPGFNPYDSFRIAFYITESSLTETRSYHILPAGNTIAVIYFEGAFPFVPRPNAGSGRFLIFRLLRVFKPLFKLLSPPISLFLMVNAYFYNLILPLHIISLFTEYPPNGNQGWFAGIFRVELYWSVEIVIFLLINTRYVVPHIGGILWIVAKFLTLYAYSREDNLTLLPPNF